MHGRVAICCSKDGVERLRANDTAHDTLWDAVSLSRVNMQCGRLTVIAEEKKAQRCNGRDGPRQFLAGHASELRDGHCEEQSASLSRQVYTVAIDT